LAHKGEAVKKAHEFPGLVLTILLAAAAAFAGSLTPFSSRASSRFLIISWGDDTPEWTQKLHVSAVRDGCSSSPTTCINEVKPKHGEKLFLSILLKTAIPGSYGAQYGVLSRRDPSLVEIGADDFVNQYEKLSAAGPDPTPGLVSLIDGIKAGNPNLGFGLTVYEDELQSPYLSDAKFPLAERAKVDYVHFFIHYRIDTPKTPDYIQQVKTIFPNAKVILGVYAYDRISYLPCSKGGSDPCTPQQELDYLRQGLDLDLGLVKDGTAAGIEFWPGSFGKEDAWKGWDEPRICPGRKSDCIQNTQRMRQVVAQEFSRQGM
jgi:hypothetical protein